LAFRGAECCKAGTEQGGEVERY